MTQDIVNSLIECEKMITVKPKKAMYQTPNNIYVLRNEFSCMSIDNQKQFDIFMRLNTKFSHQFSIGLMYRSKEGSAILCRYNGKQEHTNKIADHNKFEAFHIHKLYDHQLSDVTINILDATPTKNYISFDEALYCFLFDCHINNWQPYFPDLEFKISQLPLI